MFLIQTIEDNVANGMLSSTPHQASLMTARLQTSLRQYTWEFQMDSLHSANPSPYQAVTHVLHWVPGPSFLMSLKPSLYCECAFSMI